MRPTTPFAASYALGAALLLQGAAAFQLWLNTDSLSGRPVPPEAAAAVQGLLGGPTAAAAAFGDVPRVVSQPWDQWVPSDGAAALQDFAGPGLDADEVSLWGEGRTMLTPEQLNTVAASPAVNKAIILIKSFGPQLAYKDAVTASIDNQACSGAAMEASAGYWCAATDSPRQPHFTAARYAADAGKRLFIAPPATDASAELPQQMECLADALYDALGDDFFCSDSLRIVAPAYSGILALRDKRAELCATGGGAAVADVAEQTDDDEGGGVAGGDGSRVHASGLTVDEIFSRIKSKRQLGRQRRKMPVSARTVRRSRRERGTGRTAEPTVATRIVAVDAEGKADGGGDTKGAVRVRVSTTVEEDEEEEVVEGGPGWWQRVKDTVKACCDGMKACCEGMIDCCKGMKDCMKACCEGMKSCMKACCEGMKSCMKACCDGMKACCKGMKDGMKACCEGMKSCMKACCDGMKACCKGMKAGMKACCEGMKACCEGMKDCMKACCDGMKDCMKACCEGMTATVKAACKCMKKVVGFTEEADEHEAH